VNVPNHTIATLTNEYNNEVIVPAYWLPPRFDKQDWLWIKNIAQVGPARDGLVSDVRIEGPDGRRLNCQHRTQPGRNCTIFYRRVAENMILLLGIGRHVGQKNARYKVKWADGSASTVDLGVKRSSGEEFLPNPIGGRFSFNTLDAVLNRL